MATPLSALVPKVELGITRGPAPPPPLELSGGPALRPEALFAEAIHRIVEWIFSKENKPANSSTSRANAPRRIMQYQTLAVFPLDPLFSMVDFEQEVEESISGQPPGGKTAVAMHLIDSMTARMAGQAPPPSPGMWDRFFGGRR